MVRPGTCLALLFLFGVVGCNSESRAPAFPLLVLPGATNVETAHRYDGEVTYTLEEACDPLHVAAVSCSRDTAATLRNAVKNP